MSNRILLIATVAAIALGACATSQESPIYQQSTKYKGSQPQTTMASHQGYQNYHHNAATHTVAYDNSYGQTQSATPIVYQSERQPDAVWASDITSHQQASYTTQNYSQANQDCQRKETTREIIGGAVGGSVGAYAGKELIGGTKGTVIGAVVGGAAGYGIGDMTVNCEPVQNRPVQPQTYQEQAYATQSYPTQSTSVQSYPAQAYPASTATTAHTQYASTTAPQITHTQPMGYPAVETAPMGEPVYTAPTDEAYSDDMIGTPGYHAIMAAQNTPQPATVTPEPVMPEPPQTYTASAPVVGTPLYSDIGYTRREIVEGDTVYSMARNLCVDIEDIQRLNNIDGTFNIRLGDTIQLPQSRC